MPHVFPPRVLPSLPIVDSDDRYSVSRIFCVGRNYAAHAAEMGDVVDREAPWYFMKSAFALAEGGRTLPYPPGTKNFHYEMELVVVLGDALFEADIAASEAAIYGYACGLDMTRRDRQQDGKDHRRPWDLGKDIEDGAVIAPITQRDALGALDGRRIELTVNDETKQKSTLDHMAWSCAEIISHLSHYYHLAPGDIIMTGTPAGIGPVVEGDVIRGEIDGLEPVTLTIGPPHT